MKGRPRFPATRKRSSSCKREGRKADPASGHIIDQDELENCGQSIKQSRKWSFEGSPALLRGVSLRV
jgi:hypothetical protein